MALAATNTTTQMSEPEQRVARASARARSLMGADFH